MIENDVSLDLLLQETLALGSLFSVNSVEASEKNNQVHSPPLQKSSGLIYKIENGLNTFCIRGFPSENIKDDFYSLKNVTSEKNTLLKLNPCDDFSGIYFFETKDIFQAEYVCEQIINRRFPHREDALCNVSDPGFSWWMETKESEINSIREERLAIYFRSHGINRAEKYIQLGPIGDPGIAMLRMNQAKNLLRSSFPISEFSCDDLGFTLATQKPDHLSFINFKNIFSLGRNETMVEDFPDNSLGKTLYYYFQELAAVRKFWIEVKSKLS